MLIGCLDSPLRGAGATSTLAGHPVKGTGQAGVVQAGHFGNWIPMLGTLKVHRAGKCRLGE